MKYIIETIVNILVDNQIHKYILNGLQAAK